MSSHNLSTKEMQKYWCFLSETFYRVPSKADTDMYKVLKIEILQIEAKEDFRPAETCIPEQLGTKIIQANPSV